MPQPVGHHVFPPPVVCTPYSTETFPPRATLRAAFRLSNPRKTAIEPLYIQRVHCYYVLRRGGLGRAISKRFVSGDTARVTFTVVGARASRRVAAKNVHRINQIFAAAEKKREFGRKRENDANRRPVSLRRGRGMFYRSIANN